MSEEDIKIVEGYIKDTPILPYECLMNLERNAIEHLLKEYKKQSKEIKELNIKILSNAGIYQLGFNDGKETINNKIKAKIEELEKIHKNQDWTQKQGFYYDCLQELLEEE